MNKFIVAVAFFLFFVSNSFSQLVEGALKTDNRTILTDIKPVIDSPNYDGVVYFTIAVNEYGNITSAVVDEARTTIISTPAKINAKQMINSIKFDPGTHFPKNHTGIYKITYKKSIQK